MSEIPWEKLGVPSELRGMVGPDAPLSMRQTAARGLLPATPDVQLALLYVCAATGDSALRALAVTTLNGLSNLAGALSHRTHTKVLEFLVEFRAEPAVDALVRHHRNLNDRSAILLAERADERAAEAMCDDHERLMVTPDVLVALHQNPRAANVAVERAIAFLRMEHALPELPAQRGGSARVVASAPPPPVIDLDAEIEAALGGKLSPGLAARQTMERFVLAYSSSGTISGFDFNFSSGDEFSMDLLNDGGAEAPPELRVSIERRIAAMPPGKKIKLAYLGNKESRGILLRDRNKQVALAVVKSGRMTDGEAASAAGNRNVSMDVLREIADNREFMRKYPIKVALVNNPRTPPSVAVPIVSQLQKRDLEQLARNRNVSSVLFTMAAKLMKQKSTAHDK